MHHSFAKLFGGPNLIKCSIIDILTLDSLDSIDVTVFISLRRRYDQMPRGSIEGWAKQDDEEPRYKSPPVKKETLAC